MRLVLVAGLLLVAGCSRTRPPAPYPPVSAEVSVVATEAVAVAAVVAWLPDPAMYDPEPSTVTEGPGQWTVALRYAVEPGQVILPEGQSFRVSKATGQVDVPFPTR